MCDHFRHITQHNITHSVGQYYDSEDHSGLTNVLLHILHFGKRYPEESLILRLDLEHRLRSTTSMGLNVFD